MHTIVTERLYRAWFRRSRRNFTSMIPADGRHPRGVGGEEGREDYVLPGMSLSTTRSMPKAERQAGTWSTNALRWTQLMTPAADRHPGLGRGGGGGGGPTAPPWEVLLHLLYIFGRLFNSQHLAGSHLPLPVRTVCCTCLPFVCRGMGRCTIPSPAR